MLPTPARGAPPAAPTRRQPLDASVDALATLNSLYTAPFGFVLRPLVNQHTRSVPLVLDDTEDVASVRRLLELIATEGGFDARILKVWQLEARIRLRGARAASEVATRLCEHENELIRVAKLAIPGCADAPLALEVFAPSRDSHEVRLCLRLEVSEDEPAGDEPAENGLHDAARAIAPLLIRVAGVRPSVRISRKSFERARVSCRIRRERLLASALSGSDSSSSAEHAIERAIAALAAGATNAAVAAAHNAMIEHAVAAVALALGNAAGRVTRALEQHAMRWGRPAPLCTWRADGEVLEGELELPIELATHGRWRANDPARDIGLLAACVGMTASLVALEDTLRARALEQQRPALPPRRRRRSRPVRAEPSR